MQEVIVEKAKIEVTGLPPEYDALYVICYNRQKGRLENVPISLGEHVVPLSSSNKKSKAIRAGLLAEAIKLRTESTMSFPEIFSLLKIGEVVGWTERHFRRLVLTEIEKSK
jgi:hypothetical protein